jgi:cytidylate kinase
MAKGKDKASRLKTLRDRRKSLQRYIRCYNIDINLLEIQRLKLRNELMGIASLIEELKDKR